MNELPREIQFETFLSLPYEEIIKYCQTSGTALEICNSEVFWRTKLQRDSPGSLNLYPLVRGATPSIRYRILEKIMSTHYPYIEAINLDQSDLVRHWSTELGAGVPFEISKLDLRSLPRLVLESKAIRELASRGNDQLLDIIWDSTRNPIQKDAAFVQAFNNLVSAYDLNGVLHLMRFRKFNLLILLDILRHFPDNPELLYEALEMSDPNLVQRFIEYMIREDRGELRRFIPRYLSDVDLESLYETAINSENQPAAEYLSQYLHR